MSFPKDFLNAIAQEKQLTPNETEIFLALCEEGKSRVQITQDLAISNSALSTRLSGIYRKFSITGRGPVKESRLREYLITRCLASGSTEVTVPDDSEQDISALVQEVRSLCRDKIQHQCGTMQLLDVPHPVKLDNLYVDVNILEDIPSQRWAMISDRLEDFDPTADNFDGFYLGKVRQPRVPGLKAAANNLKLMVLGKPGSGKTTFLKHLAIECNKGNFQANRLPIFIGLRRFADATRNNIVRAMPALSLQEYIHQELQSCDFAAEDVESLLKSGIALILLDGLDEVSEKDIEVVRQQIIDLSERYYKNQFVLTCRTQAQRYRFEGFKYVEVADFNQEQIEAFAKKWFVAVAINSEEKDPDRAAKFVEKLKQPENKRVRDLAVTPILLSLTCLVFNDLADLPTNRAKLYEQGLNILLTRWDESRGIQRDEVYQNLSFPRKIKLLIQVASALFKEGDYFFEQDKIQQIITNYLCTLPNAKTDLDELQLDSRGVLKAIEAQHGLLIERDREIYSFSHLTFQEYFTAREIVTSCHPQALQNLVMYITEKRWREVFLLVVGMLSNADELLQRMKQQIDALMTSEESLQLFLSWVNQKSKSISVEVPYKSATIRALYFNHNKCIDAPGGFIDDFAFENDLFQLSPLASALDPQAQINPLDFELGIALGITKGIALDYDSNSNLAPRLSRAIDNAINCAATVDGEFLQLLEHLREQLPDPNNDWDEFDMWWQANQEAWTKEIIAVMTKHRNIGYNWRFNEMQNKLLKQYYDANQLLVDCLNSDCHVSPEVRQEIEETLLLPIAQIKQG